MKKYLLILILFLLPILSSAQRIQYSVNENWKFLRSDNKSAVQTDFNDSAWTSVNLPHTWNDKDVLDDEPGYYRGIGWYRKNLFLGKSNESKRVICILKALIRKHIYM